MALVHINRQVQAGLHRVTMELRHRASALPKIDMNKVPDWHRRATRLSISLVFFGLLGHSVKFPADQQTLALNFRQSCNWAAITCIVVTAPLIGKVAQVAFDRLLGTLVGGLIGYMCFTTGFHLFGVFGAGIFISLMAGLVVWLSTFLASRRPLEQLVRFVQLTYIIVAFGAKPDKGAFLLALMRIGGIFAGGLFSVLLAVVVLPRSASVECLREMRKALQALHELNKEVWALSGVTGGTLTNRRNFRKHHRHGYSALHLNRAGAEGGGGTGGIDSSSNNSSSNSLAAASAGLRTIASESLIVGQQSNGRGGGRRSDNGGGGGVPRNDFSVDHLDLLAPPRDEELHYHEARIEEIFSAVYSSLGRVDENLAQTKGEIYVWHFWGRYFFVPGVHWFPLSGRWQVPRQDLEDLATCLRRVARMLWTLLLDFEEGFGAEMEAVLQLYYPKQLLSELANYQGRAIKDLLEAFPGSTTIEVDNLLTLGQVTDCLLQISDARARNTVFNVKQRRRNTTGSAAGATAAAAAASPSGAAAATDGSSRGGSRRGATAAAAAVAVAASGPATPTTGKGPASSSLEKVPLLASHSGPFSTAAGTAAAAATSPPKHDGSVGGGGGGGGSVHAGRGDATSVRAPSGGADGNVSGGGGGVFISRLLSGQPGNTVALHLPPRKLMQQQQQQQQEREREQQAQQQQQPRPSAAAAAQLLTASGSGPAAAAATLPAEPSSSPAAATATSAAAAAPAAGSSPLKATRKDSERFDIFSGMYFDALAPAATAAAAAATGTAKGAVHLTASSSTTTAGPAAATAPLAAAAAASAAASALPAALQSSQLSYTGRMSWREPPSYVSLGGTAGASGAASGGGTRSASATEEASGAAGAGGGDAGSAGSGERHAGDGGGGGDGGGSGSISGGGGGGLDLLGGLGSRLSSIVVEPVTFPSTEEGYLSQVRWYSFQFVMDEMVNELEEAFYACSAVLRKLPYPVGK
ncbi:hypothetical protein Agub_g7103 [Astrephomene gubernaculifera]|uniref:Integral membrane bound transporter domain-containing protein n=1 Tax=Astrephomene gubernaculifera TaxID=47775 RepID=A0AAD3DPZ6_9CHLO|nr:hypothetical protein Agub_g7103 [Astrephomene gubernaculifera]